jgi:hypothetical protein
VITAPWNFTITLLPVQPCGNITWKYTRELGMAFATAPRLAFKPSVIPVVPLIPVFVVVATVFADQEPPAPTAVVVENVSS